MLGAALLLGACGGGAAAAPGSSSVSASASASVSASTSGSASAVAAPESTAGPGDPSTAAPPASAAQSDAQDAPVTSGSVPESPSVTGDDPGFGQVAYPARPTEPPDDPAAQFQQDILLPAGAHDVPGTLTLPATNGRPAPAVLLLHGDFGDRHASNFDELEEVLADRGIASLAIDFAGSGESEESQLDLSYDSMLTDANASLSYLAGDPELAADKLAVLGFSRGGSIAATMAGTRPDVAALVSWSGAVYNGYDELPGPHEQARISGYSQFGDDLEVPLAWFDSIEASHPLDDVAGYTGPVLALAGSDDDVVDPSLAQAFIDTVASTDKTLHIVDGAGHGLDDDEEHTEDAVTTTADWLVSRLGS